MPLINLKLHANVSELTLYLKCPRQVYYTCRKYELAPEITPQYLEHMMLKELAIGYPDAIERATSEKQSIHDQLNIEMERVKAELELIYSTELRDLSHKYWKLPRMLFLNRSKGSLRTFQKPSAHMVKKRS